MTYYIYMNDTQATGRKPFDANANDVMAYLMGYFEDNGFMPTRREIAATIGLLRGRTYTTEWARLMLLHLQKNGRVIIDPHRHRGITLVLG